MSLARLSPSLSSCFPAAGAILLAGRGWRFPRIFTGIVGLAWSGLSFLAVLCAVLWQR